MILQALAGYYRRMADETEGKVAPEGWEYKEIPFLIVVDDDGEFISLTDIRQGEGKKKRGRITMIPKGVKKSVNIKSNLLWGAPDYIFGLRKNEKDTISRAQLKKTSFVKAIRDMFPEPVTDMGIKAVLSFLDKGDCSKVYAHPEWKGIIDRGDNITFSLNTPEDLICQRNVIINAIERAANKDEETSTSWKCLVSGIMDTPAELHTAIKGVYDAQPSGANIVSFNLDAFKSYGKEKCFNAPVGKKSEFAYTTALNTLLARDSRQKLRIGDSTTVFWADRKDHFEDVFADIFGESAKENPEQLTNAVHALYKAPETGAPPQIDEDYTRFYVLGLAPNAARIAVRFWYGGTVGETARHIRQHFDDCDIVHGPNQPEHLSLFRMLVSTAAQVKSENILPNLAGDFMMSILKGTPYPQTLLSSAVRRCRAEQEVNYPRAALLKAVLARESRYYKRNEKEAGMSLDNENTNVGYRLGRLFAVLEKIQEEANPGINATIRDRFYGSASSAPAATFAQLMKLKNHHLAKLENRGRAVNFERIIGEIMDGVSASGFPTHLSLQDQGRFAVGYYHQRQDLFTKKNTNKEEIK
jgi:CRISPR-associated protein Csd1